MKLNFLFNKNLKKNPQSSNKKPKCTWIVYIFLYTVIFVADLPKGKYVYKDKIDSVKYTENVFLNGRNKHRATKQNKIK